MEKAKKQLDPKQVAEVYDEVNKAAGYDVALAFAGLNAMSVNEQIKEKIPLYGSKVDIVAASDVILRATGGNLTANTLGMLIDFFIAYGWHWCAEGESLLRSEKVREAITEYVDKNRRTLVAEKVRRKEALRKSFEAIDKAIEKADQGGKMLRAMKK